MVPTTTSLDAWKQRLKIKATRKYFFNHPIIYALTRDVNPTPNYSEGGKKLVTG
jgi:hypothetical protein